VEGKKSNTVQHFVEIASNGRYYESILGTVVTLKKMTVTFMSMHSFYNCVPFSETVVWPLLDTGCWTNWINNVIQHLPPMVVKHNS